MIDGLTGDQRFFLAWAQVWRSKYRDEALRKLLVTDPHSAGEYPHQRPAAQPGRVVRRPSASRKATSCTSPPDERVRIW